VPITGQTFAVLLVGASLGTVRGASSALLYVLIGIAGAPVYADGAHGWAQITSASGGYLVGFILAAALTGRLAEQRGDRRFSSALGAILTGNVIIFLVGLPWLAIVLDTNLEKTLEYGLYPFIPGEILKLYLAAALLPTAWRYVTKNPQPTLNSAARLSRRKADVGTLSYSGRRTRTRNDLPRCCDDRPESAGTRVTTQTLPELPRTQRADANP